MFSALSRLADNRLAAVLSAFLVEPVLGLTNWAFLELSRVHFKGPYSFHFLLPLSDFEGTLWIE